MFWFYVVYVASTSVANVSAFFQISAYQFVLDAIQASFQMSVPFLYLKPVYLWPQILIFRLCYLKFRFHMLFKPTFLTTLKQTNTLLFYFLGKYFASTYNCNSGLVYFD